MMILHRWNLWWSILEKFFYMDRRKATEVMLEAHMKGKAVCGFYSKDFAETKVYQVIELCKITRTSVNLQHGGCIMKKRRRCVMLDKELEYTLKRRV